MAKKPLGKDKFGVQKVMRTSDYFADSLGMFSLNAITGLAGQLTYFYTDKVGMSAGIIATVLLLVRICDAFTDVIMGNIVDHTAPGKEKYRPWIIRMMIPAAIVMVLQFTMPAGASGSFQAVYLFVTNFLLTAIIYTAISIPYTALQVVRTNSQEERGKMGIWRAAAGYVSGMIIAIGVIPLTNLLGGDQAAWVKLGFIFALLLLLAFFICWKRAKESAVDSSNSTDVVEERIEEPVPFWTAIRNLFGNKYWVMTLILGVMASLSYAITGSSGTYYCKLIYGDDNLVAILGAVGMIPTIVGFGSVGLLTKRLGVTKTLRISFFIGMVATAIRIINPTDFVFNTVLGCFASYATIPMMCLLGVMTAMAIDYNEYKYDKKMVATSQAASGFAGKIGSGIGGSIIGWCLAIANYDGLATVVTPEVQQAVFTFGIYIPLVLFIVMFVVSMKFDLEAKLPSMREEVATRKANK